MSNHRTRTNAIAAAALTAALAGAAGAPAAQASYSAGETAKVTAAFAYVDDKAPGIVFSGTVFKGNTFKIDRTHRVKAGSAKGLWYHGTARVTGEHAKNSKGQIRPFTLTGWVKASAFVPR